MREKSERAEREEKILQFWKDQRIFEKSLEKDAPEGEFVFYEGPPTANGKPAIHHLESRAFKDAIPRYKTMRGFRVPRRAGWDTHGLPVELEVEKTLGLKSKKEIEEYGIAKFNKECRASVQKYVSEWAKFTDRIGYWVNLDDAYFTYDSSYIEAVWSILAHTEKRKLLYKDYKVLPWCPRCGTALSSHELAQGYKDVKDLSLYVKFKVKGQDNTYFVAWTTTPWTLPGNVALAVGKDIEYVKYNWAGEFFIVARDRAHKWPGHEVEKFKGTDLVGIEYEPLYEFSPRNDKSHRIYAADFVTTENGTGIVHTAVMYGQDDFELGTKSGLPKKHLVSPDGIFAENTAWLQGRSVVDENLSVDILKDLQSRGLLFDKENYSHSYPFCWRCKTRLIYYARDSWYIKMSELRDKLVKTNEKINWEPKHIRDGRFGEWLKEVKDWAISRERYWGTPLPIWQNSDGSKRFVINSTEMLKKYIKPSGNKYFVMRHGEAENNVKRVVSMSRNGEHHLTELGKKQVLVSAEKLLSEKIDLIVSSPFTRAKETAEIVSKTLKLNPEAVIFDERLREYDAGEFDGKDEDGLRKYLREHEMFNHSVPGGESFNDTKRRLGEALYDFEKKYQNKNILIITHKVCAWLILTAAKQLNAAESEKLSVYIKNGELVDLDTPMLPHNENFELDLHRPYIDEIVLVKDGEEYRRVKEVLDVWFDSGSMPFAQDPKNILYPADFISEAIDQTRGWFYTLHAVGVLMEKGMAYKNVICLGHLLDKEGKKMSKSIGNVVDPWEEIDKHGVDALRFWMYSVNQPGESKNFDTTTVGEINRKVFNILDNVFEFYDLYRDKKLESSNNRPKSEHILDRWILARLDELVLLSTSKLDDYKPLEPVRAIREFIDDLSTWYLKYSRKRIKEADVEAKQTLYFVLKTFSKLLAPFAPFTAEDLYQKLRNKTEIESVHLCSWPTVKKNIFSLFGSDDVLEKMAEVRRIASLGLQEKQKAKINVGQPISEVRTSNKIASEFGALILKDVFNTVKIEYVPTLETELVIDPNLTDDLKEKDRLRLTIRKIQEWRKLKGLKPGEIARYQISELDKDILTKHADEIKKITNIIF